MVFRIAGGLLAVLFFWLPMTKYQNGELTSGDAYAMVSLGVLFLAYAIMGPKRVKGFFTSAAGDEEDAQEKAEEKTKLS